LRSNRFARYRSTKSKKIREDFTMRDAQRLARKLIAAYRGHHENNPLLLEAIGILGVIGFSAFYIVRLTGRLPERWDDINFRLPAIVLCMLLALRRFWPKPVQKWYLPFSYVATFYCLAFFLPITLLENGGAANTIINMVIGVVLIILLTDWRNTVAMLLGGYVASTAVYWVTSPSPHMPTEFLLWWIPLCTVLVAGGSISKYVEKRAELQRLRRLYDGLAGSIAHEMRSPLADVLQALDTIGALVPPDSEAAAAAGHGRRAVRRGLQAITLTLQQLRRPAWESTQFQTLSAALCVRKALSEYAFADPLQKSRVSVHAEEDFLFRGDETALMLALFNLMKNALYYVPLKPGMEVLISVKRSPQPSIVVRDTGPGIAPQLLPCLFEEFRTSGKAEGTGLGLAFCKRAMLAMGGDIKCRSEIGEFTEFTLVFPREPESNAAIVEKQPGAAALSEDTRTLAAQSVLVVDDSALNRAVARAHLVALGARVTEATHAAEALGLLREGIEADAILMDMNMPGMSGLEATRILRTLPGPVARTPVLLATADPTPRARDAAIEAGVDAFLVKPLEAGLLCSELMELLHGPASRPAPTSL
jgi:signal transduction histidine kinase/ActR/RegA family two-component response regulator